MFTTDPSEWAHTLFGQAELGDKRRTSRLVKLATDMAEHAGQSIPKASDDPSSIEGAYRFIRNDAITPEDIAQSGYQFTDQLVKDSPLVLALQDTTGLSYRHSVCEELGSVNSASGDKKSPKGRTLYAHSTLMMDAQKEQVLGLADQYFWYRQEKNQDKTHQLQSRDRTEKESFKWQRNSEQLKQRLGSTENVIEVCDREADMYEYLDYHKQENNRFVVRASENRKLVSPESDLTTHIATLKPSSEYEVAIQQKGGRRARKAKISLSYGEISLKRPQRAKCQTHSLSVNMLVCQEISADNANEPLCWILYTSEPVRSPEEARRIVRYYELRWRIEEFHKIWKSEGTLVESLRMQSRDNLKRVAIIQAFIAVRIFQLRELAQNREEAKIVPCTVYFSEISWKLLWGKTNKKEPLPSTPPSLYWAYYALAKLGKWYDGTKTGRVGTKAIWEGWTKLAELVQSYHLIKGMDL